MLILISHQFNMLKEMLKVSTWFTGFAGWGILSIVYSQGFNS